MNSIFGFLRSGLADSSLPANPRDPAQDIKEGEAVCIHAIQIIADFKSSVISSSPLYGRVRDAGALM